MKKILGLLTALLLGSPVMADDVAVASSHHATATWVVIDDEVYFCTMRDGDASPTNPICYEAEMED